MPPKTSSRGRPLRPKTPYTRARSSSATASTPSATRSVDASASNSPVINVVSAARSVATEATEVGEPASSSSVNSALSKDIRDLIKDVVGTELKAALTKPGQSPLAPPPEIPSHTVNEVSAPSATTISVPSYSAASPGQSSSSSCIEKAVSQLLQEQGTAASLTPLSPEVNFDVPLGATLSDKIRAQVIARQYVELYSLLDPANEMDAQFTNEEHNLILKLTKRSNIKKVKDIDQWVSAINIYGAIYLGSHPTEASAFLKYIELIQGMARQSVSGGWRIYDETFRRARQFSNLSWDRPLVHQYVSAMVPVTGSNFRNDNQQPTFRNPNTRTGSFRIPTGYCWKYNTSICSVAGCRYTHSCSKCKAPGHPMHKCKQRK